MNGLVSSVQGARLGTENHKYEFSKFEQSLSKAVDNAKYWQDVCDDVSRIFGAVGSVIASFKAEERGPWLVHSKSLDNALSVYVKDGWHENDFRQRGLDIGIQKGYFTDHDLISAEEMEAIPYYRDFLFKQGLGSCIIILIDTPNGIWALCVQDKKGRPPLSDDEIRTILHIKNRLTSATDIAAKRSSRKLQDLVSLLADAQNDILMLNSEAKILERYDGMGLYQDVRVGRHFHDLINPIFKDEVLAVCTSPANSNERITFTHKRNDVHISTSLLPMPASIRHYFSTGKALACTSKLLQTPNSFDKHLQRNYNLTKSEIVAMKLLAEGYGTEDISELLGIEKSTVRQRFKVIYSKTGVSTQAKLVTMMFKIQNGSWEFH